MWNMKTISKIFISLEKLMNGCLLGFICKRSRNMSLFSRKRWTVYNLNLNDLWLSNRCTELGHNVSASILANVWFIRYIDLLHRVLCIRMHFKKTIEKQTMRSFTCFFFSRLVYIGFCIQVVIQQKNHTLVTKSIYVLLVFK